MIGDALALERERAQPQRAGGHGRSRHALERLAVRPGVRDGGIPRHARREAMALEQLGLREQQLDALVNVAEPLLELEHLLADDREAKMPGLDDARMHRSDRNLVHAVARDAHEWIVIRGRRASRAVIRGRRRERKVLGRPRGVPQPWPRIRIAARVCP